MFKGKVMGFNKPKMSEETQVLIDNYSKISTIDEYNDFCIVMQKYICNPAEQINEPTSTTDVKAAKENNEPVDVSYTDVEKAEEIDKTVECKEEEKPEIQVPVAEVNEAETQQKAAEITSGLIKPFFNIPVNYDNKVKPTFDFEKVHDPATTIPIMPNAFAAASILKGDIVADIFLDRIGIDRGNPVRENIKPIINASVKEMDSNPDKLDTIAESLYLQVAKVLGIATTPKGTAIIGSQIKDIYLTATQQPSISMMQQPAPNGPIPVSYTMEKDPCLCPACQENTAESEKVTSAFKVARKIASANNMTIKVVPIKGLYRADVIDANGTVNPDKSFWADLDGKILNRKNKWFPVYAPKQGLSFEDYSIFAIDDETALKGHLNGTGTNGCKLINTPKHIAKNRIIDLISMPNFGDDIETRNAINDILDRSMRAHLFKSDAVKTKNRYRIVEANNNRLVMVNDAPIRFGYQADPNEKHIKLTIRLSDGEASVSDW